jgi:E3 SUMO-protein ligase PIAS1
VDITSFIKGNDLSIKFNWSGDSQSYVAIAKLVRVNNPQEVIQKIVLTKAWTKQKIIEVNFNRVVQADDLIAGPEVVSLRDPITRSRIKIPVKSQKCKHIQCFDGETYILMNQTRAKWECPVCNSKIAFPDLFFDGYFDDILKNTPEECDSVQILEDGKWIIPKAKTIIETTISNSSLNSNGKRDLVYLDSSPVEKKRIFILYRTKQSTNRNYLH